MAVLNDNQRCPRTSQNNATLGMDAGEEALGIGCPEIHLLTSCFDHQPLEAILGKCPRPWGEPGMAPRDLT